MIFKIKFVSVMKSAIKMLKEDIKKKYIIIAYNCLHKPEVHNHIRKFGCVTFEISTLLYTGMSALLPTTHIQIDTDEAA
jgi:ribosomal protein L30E